ncbi:CbiX/SirB N-terminal domain-containing protein [Tumebacillus sp. DT12]|uniref:CbiX/SirB N-terminal domain-containing protein n=1 Tax=Tumebacillus lacus TaxID=2995335 RepID=A0ABT3WWH2_9BACL|nr:CbiX/SirB N-terminal domain-containing protein [Tumebacillus lacus]MCX7569027.1 CbiX/SirB N-terminal domain-containing protein [Tumebacillus lacus]
MKTAILLIAHGSPMAAVNEDLHALVQLVRKRSGGDCIVEAAFLEGTAPDIPNGLNTCVAQGATRVIAVPYFLLPGRHVAQDLPQELHAARARHPEVEFVQAEHLGGHELLADIAWERVQAADELWYNVDGTQGRPAAEEGEHERQPGRENGTL